MTPSKYILKIKCDNDEWNSMGYFTKGKLLKAKVIHIKHGSQKPASRAIAFVNRWKHKIQIQEST